jgi:enediyne biosynthesis protein E4
LSQLFNTFIHVLIDDKQAIMIRILITIVVITIGLSCQNNKNNKDFSQSSDLSPSKDTIFKLFQLVSPIKSKLVFANELKEDLNNNYFKYLYFLNGAGVAVADFNRDGLQDIFFVGNVSDNQLYLNQGHLQFKDISDDAGIGDSKGFRTGVTIVDINNDSYPDIYVCKSGWYKDKQLLENLLFVNQGTSEESTIPHFKEMAKEYGLDDNSHSMNSVFFDYDKDGDLDMYLLNTPVQFDLADLGVDFETIYNDPVIKELGGMDRLYRNDNGFFTDVTASANIKPDMGFGLSVSICDVNNDRWPDIFVANDFEQPDFLYINQGNGKFIQMNHEYFKHISHYSMGNDFADINNDGFIDLMVLDMSPDDHRRSKANMKMVKRESFQARVDLGYHHTYMHNMLFVNNGNASFSEVSQYSGVQSTDWSWSVLLADFDNDGLRDIHVTNGVLNDVTNRDGLKEEHHFMTNLGGRVNTQEQLDAVRSLLPSVKLSNHIFKNNGNFRFTDMSSHWGVDQLSFSNGAAYADFDNDGDLDLVCNNVNDRAFLYKNRADKTSNHYFRIKLEGGKKNTFGIGTKVVLYSGNKILVAEHYLTRGYLSASENVIHFGLGNNNYVDKIEIIWPDNKMQTLLDIKGDQVLIVQYKNANSIWKKPNSTTNKIFSNNENIMDTPFVHKDTPTNDYSKQALLPHKLSQTGPFIAIGDVNADGLDDVYFGGAANQTGRLYLATRNNILNYYKNNTFELDKRYEDQGATFFDADNDGDLDLYVVSGSYEFADGSNLLQDRLYLNDGDGNFINSTNRLPDMKSSGSCVTSSDFDNDGDIDLFVGGRLIPGKYPFPPKSYLLINNGSGKFIDATDEHAPSLSNIGMVSTAIWADYDSDNDDDLILSGEWMPITIYNNDKGNLSNVSENIGLSNTEGWWNRILPADIDNDGDIDFIAGNLGLNYKFHASEETPFNIYCADFDETGSWDIVLAKDYKGKSVPVRGKECSTEQVPFVGDKFPTFKLFAEADIYSIYGDKLKDALHYQAKLFESSFIINEGDGTFSVRSMPYQANLFDVNGILFHDFDNDGIKDILLAGNKYHSEIETTRGDAGIGCYLKGYGNGEYKNIAVTKSGFFVPGDVKDIQLLNMGNYKIILVTNNNSEVQTIKIQNVLP